MAELPPEPFECRQYAEQAIEDDPQRAAAWALLAIAGELAQIRRDVRKGNR